LLLLLLLRFLGDYRLRDYRIHSLAKGSRIKQTPKKGSRARTVSNVQSPTHSLDSNRRLKAEARVLYSGVLVSYCSPRSMYANAQQQGLCLESSASSSLPLGVVLNVARNSAGSATMIHSFAFSREM
jgi:hypothetical protein